MAKTWSHLALTYDGANLRLYVNGELVDTESSPPAQASVGPLLFGGNDDEEFFRGRLDEVRVYDRALSEGEIAADKSAPTQTLPSTPVAAYSFDAGEGELAEDLSGEHDGELVNTEWVKGKYGSAIYLDGNDDYVEIPDSPELALNEEFTIEAWVRPDEDATWESVVWKETENFYSYTLMAGGEEAGVPEGALADEVESWVDVEGEEDLTDNAWSHLALTYDGANLRLYVDGELIDTEPASPNTEDPEGRLFFGTNDDEDFFNGRIDEVRIYERALDAGELAADKATPIEAPPEAPVAAYSFDAGEGELAEDLSGEHDGALENTEWVKGKYGSAIYLDGNDDYVEIPDSPELQLAEEFTIEAWVRPESLETQAVAISKEAGNFYSYQLFVGSREETGIPEGFLAYEPFAWEDVEAEDPLVAKTWSHLALTYDGANLRLYVNGELVDTESSPPAQASVGPLLFGGNDDEEFFRGRLDEVRVYDRALSEGEIADILAPRLPEPLNLGFVGDPETPEELALVFSSAIDRPLTGGSGVSRYRYRYAINAGAFNSWQWTQLAYISTPDAQPGDKVTVQVQAFDKVDNGSEVVEDLAFVPVKPEEPAPEPELTAALEVLPPLQLLESPGLGAGASSSGPPPTVVKKINDALKNADCVALFFEPDRRSAEGATYEVAHLWWKCKPIVNIFFTRFSLFLRTKVGSVSSVRDTNRIANVKPSPGVIHGPYSVAAVCRNRKPTKWFAEAHAVFSISKGKVAGVLEKGEESDVVEDSCG